jgi:hypothetical protein
MSVSCSNLNTMNNLNPCKIADCVEHVKGLASNSSSPTDTWILTFRPGVKYEGEDVQTGFMKWWVEPVPYVSPKTNLYFSLEGLNYEIKVYRDVIRPLVDNRICPNFVKFLIGGEKCRSVSILNILKNGRSDLTGDQPAYNVMNALRFMMTAQKTRPAIHRPSTTIIKPKKLDLAVPLDKRWTYNYLLTEAIKPRTLGLGGWIRAHFTNDDNYFQYDTSRLWQVLFQSVCSIYAMKCTRMTHNDMHSSNAWVEDLVTPREVMYAYDGKCYSFTMKEELKVFDFDRSYVERLGDNMNLNGLCKSYAQCDRVSAKADMFRLFCGVVRVLNSSVNKPDSDSENNVVLTGIIQNIIELVSGSYTSVELKTIFETDNFGCQAKTPTGTTMTYDEIDKLSSVETVMHGIATLAKLETLNNPVNSENVYVCNPLLFTVDGKLKPDIDTAKAGLQSCTSLLPGAAAADLGTDTEPLSPVSLGDISSPSDDF